jgi:hypothetical protein
MDRITHQSPRQQSYGSTSSLRNDSLKHERKHERNKEGIEPNNKAAKLWRTVRQGGADSPQRPRGLSGRVSRTIRTLAADCPHPCCGPSGLSRGLSEKGNRTFRNAQRITDRPWGARGLSARHPRTVRPAHADRPKLRPTKNRKHHGSKAKPSKNTKNKRRTLCARTVRQALADRPRGTNRTENCSTPKVNTPNPSLDLPNGRSC